MSRIMEQRLIPIKRSLRYYERPSLNKNGVHLVYLLHGYGQLAYYFLRKAEDILSENVWFVAPEGTNRFYLNGTSGRVGASWMTREMRETDIAENTDILDELHEKLSGEIDFARVTVLGFSQGGATAARWVGNGKIQADHFVSWASVFPPDVQFPETLAEGMKKTFVIGQSDEFFDADSMRRAIEEYAARDFETLEYAGSHDLDAEMLEKILSL
jgi:predicted esterase